MTNGKAKHKAVMLLHIAVHEILDTGECAARPVSEDELARYNLAPKMVLQMSGFDRNDCLTRLSQAIAGLRT
jgi:hypothetical protein